MAAASLLNDLMRILTPEEISELTSTSSGNSRIELTDLLNSFEDGEVINDIEEYSAKILPFKKSDKIEEEITYQAGPKVIEYINHFYHKKSLGDTSKSSDGKSVETSTFIIKEKERFQYVQAKLKKKEVMSLYMKNANVDIEQEKTLKDDMAKSSRSGVLVNKKQF